MQSEEIIQFIVGNFRGTVRGVLHHVSSICKTVNVTEIVIIVL